MAAASSPFTTIRRNVVAGHHKRWSRTMVLGDRDRRAQRKAAFPGCSLPKWGCVSGMVIAAFPRRSLHVEWCLSTLPPGSEVKSTRTTGCRAGATPPTCLGAPSRKTRPEDAAPPRCPLQASGRVQRGKVSSLCGQVAEQSSPNLPGCTGVGRNLTKIRPLGGPYPNQPTPRGVV